jgi:hypothetical protein
MGTDETLPALPQAIRIRHKGREVDRLRLLSTSGYQGTPGPLLQSPGMNVFLQMGVTLDACSATTVTGMRGSYKIDDFDGKLS